MTLGPICQRLWVKGLRSLERLSKLPQGRRPRVPVTHLHPCQLVAYEPFLLSSLCLKALALLGSSRFQPSPGTGEAGMSNMEEAFILNGTCKVQGISPLPFFCLSLLTHNYSPQILLSYYIRGKWHQYKKRLQHYVRYIPVLLWKFLLLIITHKPISG